MITGDGFTPADFVELLGRELEWFELLMRVGRHQCELAEGIEIQVIELMLKRAGAPAAKLRGHEINTHAKAM